MTTTDNIPAFGSGKGHRDENFPVASYVIRPDLRPVVLAFYRVARKADDIADHESASETEKLEQLDKIEKSLLGTAATDMDSVALRETLNDRHITTQHALDLLEAFRRDVTKKRYADWTDLMEYCRYSAAPVGRFMLDVHGESPSTWPASDALCAALQVINHLQDCAKDYRTLDRVYLPMDILDEEGAAIPSLAGNAATPELQRVIARLAGKSLELMERSKGLADEVNDTRLATEVAVIHRLGLDLNRKLLEKDPLSKRVHHLPAEAGLLMLTTIVKFLAARPFRRQGGEK